MVVDQLDRCRLFTANENINSENFIRVDEPHLYALKSLTYYTERFRVYNVHRARVYTRHELTRATCSNVLQTCMVLVTLNKGGIIKLSRRQIFA